MRKMPSELAASRLLGASDPAAFDIMNAGSRHPVLLVCEHAGQAIPSRLGDLGIGKAVMDSHIGWDIGAGNVTRRLARRLGAPAVFQTYSRLVIDCNRPPDAVDAMPEIIDGTEIPGNRHLSDLARSARAQEIFTPFHDAIDGCFACAPHRVVFSIHSFTRERAGVDRPWDMGFLFRRDTRTSERLAAIMRDLKHDLLVGMNQPYQIEDAADWFVPRHGEARGMAHSLIEIRNDHIDTTQGQILWADLLAQAINRYLGGK
jgi:predicted N-formylglutamate amidohydrolase